MPIQVKTTVEIMYDSTLLKIGFGVIQMNSWNENQNGSFIAETEKFGMKDNVLTSIPGSAKSDTISAEMYNQLMEAINPYIPANLTPTEEREFVKKQALLMYVQNDRLDIDSSKCVWGVYPNQFEII